jgi:NTE family protein
MAHILVCEALDELGVRPALIAGTSIGAIIGAGYAAGISGREMRWIACDFYAKRGEVLTRLWRARPMAFAELFRSGSFTPQFDPTVLIDAFVPGAERLPERLEDLAIPLKVIACDFYAWSEVVLSSGELRQAIAASIAIPALFRPVRLNGRILIDGGACNPLPFDHVSECDITVACDVAGGPTEWSHRRRPRFLESLIGAAQISMQTVIREKLKRHQPDVLVRPQTNGVSIVDFMKTKRILDMNVAFKDDLKRRLDHAINTPFDARRRGLAPGAEEAAEQVGSRRLGEAGINVRGVMAGRRGKEADAVLDRSTLRVGGGVVEPADAGEGHRGRAHRARF